MPLGECVEARSTFVIMRAGATSHNAIAAELNERNVRTASPDFSH
jgi:hypothetical protein